MTGWRECFFHPGTSQKLRCLASLNRWDLAGPGVPGPWRSLTTGVVTLSLAVVGEATLSPVVSLGIKGRDRDGWYPLSQIRVGR